MENKPVNDDEDPYGDGPPWANDPEYLAHCERMEREHEIEETLLSHFRIKNEDWHINDDDSIEAGEVSLKDHYIKKIDVKFKKVGAFICSSAHALESLEGSPDICENEFYISMSRLTSLVGGPKQVGSLTLKHNLLLSSLEGMPRINKDFQLLDSPMLNFGWDVPIEILSRVGGKMRISLTENLPVLRVFDPNYEQSKVQIFWNNEEHQLDQDVYNILSTYSHTPNKKKAIYDCQYELIKSGFKGNARW
jgi:hypothetical protein